MNNKVERFPSNTQGKDYIVGDLHGCLEDLLLALKAINFDEKVDRLFSVGDLIDRGPDSEGCIQLVNKKWFHAVKGNHEDMMIGAVVHKQRDMERTWLGNGGQWIFKPGTWDMAYTEKELQTLAKKLDKLPLVIVVGEGDDRFNIVHAEFYKHRYQGSGKSTIEPTSDADIDNWNFQDGAWTSDIHQMMWGRAIIKTMMEEVPHKDLSLTYVGHTPLTTVVRRYQQLYLDTGCVYYRMDNKHDINTLTIACHTDKVIHSWYPAWKRVNTTPYSEIKVI